MDQGLALFLGLEYHLDLSYGCTIHQRESACVILENQSQSTAEWSHPLP